MTSEWRDLLYPIGFIANLCFFLRFIYQWGSSELKQKSIVDKTFWKISLFGNSVMIIHTMIQLQFAVCLIQSINGVISWRNLNLMDEPRKQWPFHSVVKLFVAASILTAASFYLQSLSEGNFVLARTPQFLGKMAASPLSLGWHAVGILGTALFASRFWIQWWRSEKKQQSVIGRTFWWISLAGAAISSIYFIMMADIVNFIGPTFGMIPYIRNLILINKQKAEARL
jgi:lipid-A-disaccharide synthase-like uncharacterized protein